MLPKNFKYQNIIKRNHLLTTLKTYTLLYDYELTSYYADYVKESYKKWGNIVDVLGIMKINGYNVEDIEFNFHQLMQINYIDTKKIVSYTLTEITHS
tara:strand:- start:80 stop:370 length:291 start_codon:yes stop_codon:yes gene_type:complete